MVGPKVEKGHAKTISLSRQFHRYGRNVRLDFRAETDPSNVWQTTETVSRIVKVVDTVENKEQSQTQ